MSNDNRLERIEVKLDDIGDHLGQMNVVLGAQHITLQEHIRRTEALESQIIPIKKHVDMVKGAGVLISLLATIAGILAVIHSFK